MSIRQGNKIIAGHINYHPDLFDHKWADHLLNDVSWLRADTFSWQDGSVYEVAYDHLADDIDGKSLSSETIAGVTVQFYLADDGHKICPDSQESNVVSIYNATGVAWYYIIDTVNERFKLPRTKFGFNGLRDTVGKYVEPGLPNITGNIGLLWLGTLNVTGAFTATKYNNQRPSTGTNDGFYDVSLDAADSSAVYGNSTTVQAPATQQYLYFYVGNFTQTAIENTAGLNASLFNDKADIDFGNTNMVDYIVEKQDPTAGNNYTWYRKYRSGLVEQGGSFTGVSGSITLPITMTDTNYVLLMLPHLNDNQSIQYYQAGHTKTITGFSYNSANSRPFDWFVSGMAA